MEFERRIIRKEIDVKDINDVIEAYGPASVVEGLFEYLSEKNINEYPYNNALEYVGGEDVYREKIVKHIREDLLNKLLELRDFAGIYFERGSFGSDEVEAFLEEHAPPLD